MENQTSFDLSQAIQQWRRNLGQSSAFQRADLDELESHLRDSMPPLQSAGLSPEEAFLVASRRIGPRQTLEREFLKSNPPNVWLGRVLWTCMILQASLIGFELARIGQVPIVMLFVILLGLAFLAGSAMGQRIVKRLLARPAIAAITLLLLALSNKILERGVIFNGQPLPAPDTLYYRAVFGMLPWPWRVTSEYWYLVFQMQLVGRISELIACVVLIAIMFNTRRAERNIAVG